MAFVAIVEFANQIAVDQLQVGGVFTDGVTKIPFSGITFVGAVSNEGVRARLAQVLEASRAQSSLTIKPGATIDLTPPVVKPPDPPPPPPDPTPEEQAKADYGVLVAKFRQFTGALVAGVPVQTERDAVIVQLSKLYLPGYEVFFDGMV